MRSAKGLPDDSVELADDTVSAWHIHELIQKAAKRVLSAHNDCVCRHTRKLLMEIALSPAGLDDAVGCVGGTLRTTDTEIRAAQVARRDRLQLQASGAREVVALILRNHDDCICRHSRVLLEEILQLPNMYGV